MDTDDTRKDVFIIIQIISVLACFWFIQCYRKFSKKTLALRMISILNITYLIFHLTVIIILIIESNFETELKTFDKTILSNILRFSVFWACSIVFVVYRSILRNGKTNSRIYFKYSFLGVISLTLAFIAL